MWHPSAPWTAAPRGPVLPAAWAHALSRRLRRLAAALLRLARRLAAPAHPRTAAPSPGELPRIEYHADAGAPEGALYVDGRYVGRLDVRRL